MPGDMGGEAETKLLIELRQLCKRCSLGLMQWYKTCCLLGDEVLQLVATDVDEGENAEVTYVAVDIPEDGAGNPIFTLSSDGLIETATGDAGDLDRETIDSYNMTVRAEDNGNPSMTCESLGQGQVCYTSATIPIMAVTPWSMTGSSDSV